MSSYVRKVSVCIPCFNAGPFIGETIRSVIQQSYDDWELVIVDDASSDNTADVVASFSDARIRWVRNEKNIGVAANWTKAVDLGRGEFVKVLCHDDLIYPDCLALQTSVLSDPANASVAMVSASRDIINANGTPIFRNRRSKLKPGKTRSADALRAIVRSGTNPLGEPGAVLFRRSIYDQSGGFRGRSIWMIDIDMWARLLQHGDLFTLRETLSAFRVSESALSTQLAKLQSSEAHALFREMREQHPELVGRADLALGHVRAILLQQARRLVYKMYLRNDDRRAGA